MINRAPDATTVYFALAAAFVGLSRLQIKAEEPLWVISLVIGIASFVLGFFALVSRKISRMNPRPFVKWAGGKRQLMPEILKYAPADFNAYYEPFVGGGAVFFKIAAGHLAYLSDANRELIATYRAIRDEVKSVIRLLSTYRYEKSFFMRVRESRPESEHEIAARFIYLNRTCFNGLYRVNKLGEFNVPFGRYKDPLICDTENLLACSQALQKATIQYSDFGRTNPSRGDFVYLDPPYVPVSGTANFTSYTSAKFDDEDQVRLRNLAYGMKARGVHVLLSNADVPRVRELYKDFEIISVSARRSVNSKPGSRGAVGEVLIR